jgi:beta propeller repeat protein
MKKLIAGITLLALVISSFSACDLTEASEFPSESWELEGYWRYSPQCIWGDTFVAGEYIFGNGLEGQYISTYNLQTWGKKRIKEIPLDYRFEEPSIYEDKVVWSSCYYSEEFRMSQQKDIDNLDWNVFLLDLKTGEERQITADEHAQRSARIYGDTIVWLDNRHEEDDEYPHYYDVYAYDLKTGAERRITTTNSIREYDLGISGSLVVWTDNRNDNPSSRIDTYPPVGNDDIYLYDLSADQEQQITTGPASDSSPVIDNGRIVWERKSAVRDRDIFLYDIETGQETQISESGYVAHLYNPSICGDRVVWADARLTRGNSAGDCFELDVAAEVSESGSAEIYLYDLGTQQEILLVPSEGTEFTERLREKEIKSTAWQVWLNPVIHGDFIVYTLAQQVSPVVYIIRLDKK